MSNILEKWAEDQTREYIPVCPRCGLACMHKDLEQNALSRRFDIYVCEVCGSEEAMEDAGYERPAEIETWYAVTGKVW